MASFLNEVESVDCFDGIGVAIFAMRGAVGREIVGAHESLCGVLHRREVKGDIAAGPKVALLKGVGTSEIKTVDVAFADSRVAGVKGSGDGLGAFYLYSSRQDRVERANELAGIMRPIGVEVKALSAGMNAGIGAPAPVSLDFLVQDLTQGIFEDILYASALGLSLPAVKVGAIVCTNAFPSHVRMLAKGARDARL